MPGIMVRRLTDLSPDNSLYKCQGFSGTAAANTTTDIDFKFPQERWLSGGALFVKGGNWGDTCTIQIVDVDNILGFGANTVLREFITNFAICDDSQFQIRIEVPYVSVVPQDIYMRIKYTNNNATNSCQVACNIFTHIPTV